METNTERVQRIVAEMAGKRPAEIPAAATFESLGLDSLDTVEILIELEDEFAVELQDDEWGQIKSVQQAVDLVERAAAAQGA